jgi:hypothetical protein
VACCDECGQLNCKPTADWAWLPRRAYRSHSTVSNHLDFGRVAFLLAERLVRVVRVVRVLCLCYTHRPTNQATAYMLPKKKHQPKCPDRPDHP